MTIEGKQYSYTRTWRLRRVGLPAAEVMALFQSDPTAVFPFPIRGQNGDDKIIQGASYDLRPLLVRTDPVAVTDVTDTSFTFTSLPGHFHGFGATVSFTVFGEPGKLYLQQHAVFPRRWYSRLLAVGSAIVWLRQAQNLARKTRRLARKARV